MANSAKFLKFRETFLRALDAGLVAAGDVYATDVATRLAGGYTSGQFTTGEAAQAVERTAPYTAEGGLRTVSVGSNDPKQLAWELGFYNIYTKRPERVEHWREAMMESGPTAAQAFAQAFDQTLQGSPS